jgi:pilus assembly protein CpaC
MKPHGRKTFPAVVRVLILACACVISFSPVRQLGAQALGPEIHIPVGKSFVFNSDFRLRRVSVTDSPAASAVIVSPRQVLIHGLQAGSVTLLVWDENERSCSYTVHIDPDLTVIKDTVRMVFPSESFEVTQSGAALILTGHVSSKDIAEKIVTLAQTQSRNVVNMLQTTDGREAVLLQVRFAEVDRAAIQQLGMNLFSTGAANTLASVTTQQFGAMNGNIGAIPPNVRRGSDVPNPTIVSGGIGNPVESTPAVFGLNDLLNVFVFRPDLNLGAAIKALQQKNILQILAEPNVLALNNTEASFLAGGEFPFPVVQSAATGNSITIAFKEFGVRLRFTPQLQSDGMIRLKVSPEVSALDFSNALTVSGFLIPALSTRRADTQVELRDGQSFAIAGLIDNRLTEVVSKVPLLGQVPILGKLFQSVAQNRSKTELLVVVTPKLVRPSEAVGAPSSPEFPKQFLDNEKFDDKKEKK